MMAQTQISADDIVEVTGAGYDPHGGFMMNGKEISISEFAEIKEIARGVMLCNDA